MILSEKSQIWYFFDILHNFKKHFIDNLCHIKFTERRDEFATSNPPGLRAVFHALT